MSEPYDGEPPMFTELRKLGEPEVRGRLDLGLYAAPHKLVQVRQWLRLLDAERDDTQQALTNSYADRTASAAELSAAEARRARRWAAVAALAAVLALGVSIASLIKG